MARYIGIAVVAAAVALAGCHKTAKSMKPILKPKPIPSHLISSLPTPERNLMHFVLSKTCDTSLSSVMDTITGHNSMSGSGEYIGTLRMTPGPHRSTNIYWTVNVRKGSPLTYVTTELSRILGRQNEPKIKYAGIKTLKFNISYNGDYIMLPGLQSPTPTLMNSGGFMAAIRFSYQNCN